MKDRLWVLVFLTVGALLAGGVMATSVERLSAEQMTDAADVIVQGYCTDLDGQWVDGALYTVATIAVSDTLKGAPGRQVLVAIPGGVDLDREVPVAFTVPGAPTIGADEDVLLFLEAGAAVKGSYAVVGFFQGKLSVVEGPGGVATAVGATGSQTALDSLKQKIRSRLNDR